MSVPGVSTDIVSNSELAAGLAGKLDTTDPAVTNAREWTAETISQEEAEAGTETIRRAITAQRLRQAISAVLVEFGIASIPEQFESADWAV